MILFSLKHKIHMTLKWQSCQPALLFTSIASTKKTSSLFSITVGMLKQEKVHAQLTYTFSASLPMKIHKERYNRLSLSTKLDILTSLENCSDLFWDPNCSSVIYLNEVIPDA